MKVLEHAFLNGFGLVSMQKTWLECIFRRRIENKVSDFCCQIVSYSLQGLHRPCKTTHFCFKWSNTPAFALLCSFTVYNLPFWRSHLCLRLRCRMFKNVDFGLTRSECRRSSGRCTCIFWEFLGLLRTVVPYIFILAPHHVRFESLIASKFDSKPNDFNNVSTWATKQKLSLTHSTMCLGPASLYVLVLND